MKKADPVFEILRTLLGNSPKRSYRRLSVRRGPGCNVPVTRTLPEDLRIAHDTPALYAVNLVTALLSSRVEGMPWPRLCVAFAVATTPSLLVQLAMSKDKAMSEAWAARWNEAASPEFLIPALRHMSSNIAVSGEGNYAVFALKEGPKPPATEDVDYDAWIALRVAEAPHMADFIHQVQIVRGGGGGGTP